MEVEESGGGERWRREVEVEVKVEVKGRGGGGCRHQLEDCTLPAFSLKKK